MVSPSAFGLLSSDQPGDDTDEIAKTRIWHNVPSTFLCAPLCLFVRLCASLCVFVPFVSLWLTFLRVRAPPAYGRAETQRSPLALASLRLCVEHAVLLSPPGVLEAAPAVLEAAPRADRGAR
jgi:hypothetical protein